MRLLISQAFKVGNLDAAIWKFGYDFQHAAHRLDVTSQGREIHIRSMFKLCN
jgi:hypothetical protein